MYKLLVLFNPRLTKGGGWLPPPLSIFFLPHKNAKATDPGHLGNLFYILCGQFDEKKIGGTPKDGGRVSRQSPRVRGVVATYPYFKVAILKNICMVLS